MKKITKSPPLMILLTFLMAIIFGTLLLLLPMATHEGISVLDAFFTATSAVCVTGLIVQDTATYFTEWGKFFILILIQIGGLGILTLSAFFIVFLTGKLGFAGKNWIHESLGSNGTLHLYDFLKRIFLFVFFVEGIGAFLLFFAFWPQYPFSKSIHLAIFHSISAFCNAGFSLFSDSLEKYPTNIYLNVVIMALIILGGLGFIVVEDIFRFFKKDGKKKQLTFHSRIVLWTTFLLIFVGAVLFFVLEKKRTPFSKNELFLSSLFQSVTCRTAGFNTIPLNEFSETSIFLSMILMFIGGSPGSTAGGIKTTSFALFLFLIFSRLRGRVRPEIFKRTVSHQVIERMLILIVSAMIIIQISTFLLLIFEEGSPYLKTHSQHFLAISFETVSAFGTVGLSMGVTPFLSSAGKVLIIMLMFIGRVGLLTLAFLMMSIEEQVKYEYPEEDLLVG